MPGRGGQEGLEDNCSWCLPADSPTSVPSATLGLLVPRHQSMTENVWAQRIWANPGSHMLTLEVGAWFSLEHVEGCGVQVYQSSTLLMAVISTHLAALRAGCPPLLAMQMSS